MEEKISNALKSFLNIRQMLDNVPRDLWYIFVPDSVDGLIKLEQAIKNFKAREADREVVISLQRMSGFPLRPNAPLRETVTKARIQGLKKSRDLKKNQGRNDEKDW